MSDDDEQNAGGRIGALPTGGETMTPDDPTDPARAAAAAAASDAAMRARGLGDDKGASIDAAGSQQPR